MTYVLFQFGVEYLNSQNSGFWDSLYPKRRKALKEAAGIRWFDSALRKTYTSYAVAYHGTADRVALVLGHNSAAMTHEHYRGIVTKAAAKEYFSLRPRG